MYPVYPAGSGSEISIPAVDGTPTGNAFPAATGSP
jgi:hypothetical protein